MQLRLDAADRLVELVEERRGPVHAEEAARDLFRLASAPAGMARTLLDEVVVADARLRWSVNPRGRLEPKIAALTGIDERALRRAPTAAAAVRRFLAFAGDAVLVAHNARFDLAFLDRETERLTGARLAAPVVDTVGLARRLLAGRTSREGLASLSRRLRETLARVRRSAAAGRLSLPRPLRPSALRRSCSRPPRAAPLVLPFRPAAAGGRGRPPRARA